MNNDQLRSTVIRCSSWDAELLRENWELLPELFREYSCNRRRLLHVLGEEVSLLLIGRMQGYYSTLVDCYGQSSVRALEMAYQGDADSVMRWIATECLDESSGDDVVDWIFKHYGERRYEPLLAAMARRSTNEHKFISRNVDLLAFYDGWSFESRPSIELTQLCVCAGYTHKLVPWALKLLPGGIQAYRQDAKLDELLAIYKRKKLAQLHIELDEFLEPYELAFAQDTVVYISDAYAARRGPEYEATYKLLVGRALFG
jgi:hypothetical protein